MMGSCQLSTVDQMKVAAILFRGSYSTLSFPCVSQCPLSISESVMLDMGPPSQPHLNLTTNIEDLNEVAFQGTRSYNTNTEGSTTQPVIKNNWRKTVIEV